ncbi:MAG: hypothetical protein AAF657_38465 [Acidobacteriota bacterium]
MTDDELMQSLGDVARRQASTEAEADPRWAALAAGELSAGEQRALQREASTSEAGQRAWEAYRPLDSGVRAQITRQVEAQLDPGAAAAETPIDEPGRAPWSFAALARWWAELTRSSWPVMASVAAALVGLVLFWPQAQLEPLPAYELSLTGGFATERSGTSVSEPGDILTLRSGSQFNLHLRPQTRIAEVLVSRAYLREGEVLRRWEEVEPEVVEGGVVRIAGRVGSELPARAGEWTLWVAVGRPGELPSDETILQRVESGEEGAAQHWVLLGTEVRVEDDA